MFKKLIFLTIALLLIATALALFVIAPYHIYTLTLTEGVNTRFLVMKPSLPVFYDGHEFQFFDGPKTDTDDSSLYRTFHFSNLLVPMPINHPVFSFIPNIKSESTGLRLGGQFLDGKNTELLSMMVEKTYRLETLSGDQQLFVLPIFKNHIHRKTDEEVWRDLFSKKLSLPSNVGKSFYESLIALKEVSYSDLVYNLYILYNRTHLFPADSTRISFDAQSGHGLIELLNQDKHFRHERLYLVDKGIIYSLTIKTKKGNLAAEHFRSKLIRETLYKNSTPDSAIPIYAQYKSISYNSRVDQQGMTYLFAAWSHDLSSREYVRVIILFLERGKANLKYLKPFYEYAYKKFGSNLSGSEDVLLETPEEKLKRKIKEDLEKEVKKEEMAERAKYEGNFSSPDEKIKFYLQKAKENKNNSDDSEKVLIQE
ncbi:MAG: hypothetical protein WC635_14855 [Bacteriovorax sp.]|jgi:hypothetical protein